ncbi:MAG: hypothetical protein AAB445_03395 [Patescibacteria group bacterium]
MEWILTYLVIGLLWVPAKIWVVFTIPLIQLTDKSDTGGLYSIAKMLARRQIPGIAVIPFSIAWPLLVLGGSIYWLVVFYMGSSIRLLQKFFPEPSKPPVQHEREFQATP